MSDSDDEAPYSRLSSLTSLGLGRNLALCAVSVTRTDTAGQKVRTEGTVS